MTAATAPSIVIIGLDGADWVALRPLMDDGAMPALKAFVERGASARLDSVLPTNSMSAWTSFMTGVNPGRHGVYEFVRKTSTPFRTAVTNSSVVRFPALWQTLAAAGRSSCAIDMPPLYPPLPVDGCLMLGGIGARAAEGRAYTWPRELAGEVESAVGGFVADVPWTGKSGQEEQLVADLIALVENRVRVTEHMLDRHRVDLLCSVFVAPDRLQHVFWQDLTQHGPHYALARRFYEAQDAALARLLDRIDLTKTDVLIVSDHGFRPLHKAFDVNAFLRSAGFLSWEGARPLLASALRLASRVPPVRSWIEGRFRERGRMLPKRELSPRSVAYSDLADSVSVNIAGRETTGSVPAEEQFEVEQAVTAALLEFRDPESGNHVVGGFRRRDDYFSGPYLDEAPDLLIEFNEGYGYGRWGVVLAEWPHCQGVHSRNGIIAAAGPHFRRGEQAPPLSIMDVAPTVLSLLEVPVPAGTDGRVAESLLAAPVRVTAGEAPAAPARAEPGAYSEEEEEQVRERLRGLGYLD